MKGTRIPIPVVVFLALVGLSGCVTSSTSMVQDYAVLPDQVRVAVIDFENKTKYGERRLADSAAEILVSEMSRSGNFILIERKRLEDVLKELEFQMSDLTDGENTAQIGNILNCEYLVYGVVSNFGVKTEGRDLLVAKRKIQTAQAEVDIKIVDVETAEIVYSAYGKGTAQKSIGSALGLGGTGGYDETLAGDCLRAAISEAVQRQVEFFKRRQL